MHRAARLPRKDKEAGGLFQKLNDRLNMWKIFLVFALAVFALIVLSAWGWASDAAQRKIMKDDRE